MTRPAHDPGGIIVDDLSNAVAFLTALGLELEGEGTVEGVALDRIVGLEGSGRTSR
jgi:hypothetical protein